jgi:hypothetical protein
MKAYMSEQDRRTGIYKRLAAIDEAKRILADAEPLQFGNKLIGIAHEREILAEALENFIATLDKMGH